ncbi:MAG: VOC family protein [Pseudomonadota bacterium]
MGHKSRLGVIVIDCQTQDLDQAAAFWGQALGADARIEPDGKYATIGDRSTSPVVLLQAVDHPPRVHLDIESDDQEAEVARLKALGAVEVGTHPKWTILEAPTGHRFCIIKPQNDSFAAHATEHPDA